MKKIHTHAFILLQFFFGTALLAQSYGGDIKLKFTYEDTPLAGYDITTSINGIEIKGGKGKTDSEGVVRMSTEPLPIPDIDVKGVSMCANSERKFEASGFVHVLSSNDNYFHLDLKKVAEQMASMSGMSIDVFMESFGVKCLREKQNGGSGNSGRANSGTSAGVSAKGSDVESDASSESENEAKAKTSKMMEEFKNQTPAERYQALLDMKSNQLYRIDKKLEKTREELEDEGLSPKKKNDLLYDEKELMIERDLKQNEVDKVQAEIDKGNRPLNKMEKEPFKQKEAELKEGLDQVKSDRKKGVSLVEGEGEDGGLASLSESDIAEMSTSKLKKTKFDTNVKLKKKKFSLKSKGKMMSDEKRQALEAEIAGLEKTLELLNAELEGRK